MRVAYIYGESPPSEVRATADVAMFLELAALHAPSRWRKTTRFGVGLGPSLRRDLDDLSIAQGQRRNLTASCLVLAALLADADPPLDEGRWLDDERVRGEGEVTFVVPVRLRDLVDERARKMGESRSEAFRSLLLAGMAVQGVTDPKNGLAGLRESILGALEAVEKPLTTRQVARSAWRRSGTGDACRRLLERMEREGLVVKEDGRWTRR